MFSLLHNLADIQSLPNKEAIQLKLIEFQVATKTINATKSKSFITRIQTNFKNNNSRC